MNILIVCSSGSPYVLQLWKCMKRYYPDITFSLLTNDTNVEYYQNGLSLEKEENIFYYHYDKLYMDLRRVIKKLPSFDIMHFLWIERQMGLLVNELKKKTKRIYTSVGGSDLYRDSKKLHVRMWQRRLLKNSDWFSSENEMTHDYFYKVYGDELRFIQHSIVNFGVDIIDSIDRIDVSNIVELKEKYGIPKDKIVVTLGYNGRCEQQHLEMIKAIGKLDKNSIEKLFFIIPMTYLVPSEDYVNAVSSELNEYTSQYIILRKYMTTDEMAEGVVISDVMIHVQTTDQLSSTMLAHMYNGNIVIAGSWLPYSNLVKKGIVFYQVDRITEMTELFKKISNNLFLRNSCGLKDNRKLVYDMSSWEKSSSKWYEVYSGLYDVKYE